MFNLAIQNRHMNTQLIKSKFAAKNSFWLIIGVVLLSLLLRDFPFFNFLFAPFNQFETMLHEMSHAIACVMTGGTVSGLTIVEDGNGHGGLTFTRGGIPFIYSQAGYIGETLWGCLLIALSRFPRISRAILITIGLGIAGASIYFVPGAIFMAGMWLQGIGSLIWGLAIAAALIWVGNKVSDGVAHFILLFLAVQSCLGSLQGLWVLLLQSMGAFPGTWSDATNMAQLTGIPAPFWGISWALFSIGMLSWVMWMTYKSDHAQPKKTKTSQIGEAAAAKQISSEKDVEIELQQLHQSIDLNQASSIKLNKQQRKKS